MTWRLNWIHERRDRRGTWRAVMSSHLATHVFLSSRGDDREKFFRSAVYRSRTPDPDVLQAIFGTLRRDWSPARTVGDTTLHPGNMSPVTNAILRNIDRARTCWFWLADIVCWPADNAGAGIPEDIHARTSALLGDFHDDLLAAIRDPLLQDYVLDEDLWSAGRPPGHFGPVLSAPMHARMRMKEIHARELLPPRHGTERILAYMTHS